MAHKSRRLKPRAFLAPALRRLVTPRHALHALRLARNSRRQLLAYDDSRLAVVAELLPGGFLNYGYHLPPYPAPEEISLADIQRAQRRYAELIADCIADKQAPVLDVGCGMGGLIRLLLERGHEVVGLTPDKAQAAHLRAQLPQVPIIEERFEVADASPYHARFGTVITAESLQYLLLPLTLEKMEQLLAPGGLWIAFDYFRISEDLEGSGHAWPQFRAAVEQAGLRIESNRDLTENVMPTLSFMHLWARKLALPLVDLIASDLQRKHPGLHHLLLESLEEMRRYTETKAERVEPAAFAATRRYRLVLMRRAGD